MKRKDVTARLEQDMAGARALGDMNAVAMIAIIKEIMFEIRDERLFHNLGELISQIKQHINQRTASYKVLSFTLALCYLKRNRYRHQLCTSDKSADTLKNYLNIMIDTDNILQLPNLPAKFVRQAKAEQEKEVKTLRAFLKKNTPRNTARLIDFTSLRTGQASTETFGGRIASVASTNRARAITT